MQHTETYKLNLIETSDPFSPAALNQNMEMLETILTQRPQIVYGTHTGTGDVGAESPCRLEFPFKPLLVVFCNAHSSTYTAGFVWPWGAERAISVCYNDSHYRVNLSWTNNSVSWYSTSSVIYQLNAKDYTYHYIAIGV